MKLLVIGGNGMAGHMLVQYFKEQPEFSLFYTSRDAEDEYGLLLDVTDIEQVDRLVMAVRPHVIINAVGILNQAAESKPIEAYQVNGLLPHRLRQIADRIGARVIHISTDCVFSGSHGSYIEADEVDGTSMYAVTKALGELRDGTAHVTIRTSIIGPEIRKQGIGLLNWFLQQQGVVQGYRHVWWNGVTTLELAKAIHYYVNRPVGGLLHLAHPKPINKHDLLMLMQQAFRKEDVTIEPSNEPVLDRTLVNTRSDADYPVPPYRTMLAELAERMRQR
ncbi:SDR family oxidoreductase [Paenibacillus sp. 481]|uniref:SDR family oxidoreductase n=1 Tax=Paenibacillus sp. 481 TaxID=2835869 RepID=UPI001E3A01CA|nr:SDR family oxidoreductase [Paenibacillus sp. 481]UHA74495.1 SDR family oxidoreductase [Paenibacillus sp. 481]